MSEEKFTPTQQIYDALSTAQGEIKSVPKNGVNPHFQSTYATLDDIMEALREPLQENGLAVMQMPTVNKESSMLEMKTVILHSSGAKIEHSLNFPFDMKLGIQKLGAAITYLRRYSISSIFRIAAEEDDDGNQLMKQNNNDQRRQHNSPRRSNNTQRPQNKNIPIDGELFKMLKEIGDVKTGAGRLLVHLNQKFKINFKHLGELKPDHLKFAKEFLKPHLDKIRLEKEEAKKRGEQMHEDIPWTDVGGPPEGQEVYN